MIKVTPEEYDRLKAKNGYVLVEIEKEVNDTVSFQGNSIELFSVGADSTARNVVKHGKVLSVCETTNTQGHWDNLDENPMVEVGDKVCFDYMPIANYVVGQLTGQKSHEQIITDGERKAITMAYGFLYMRERNGVRYPLNGLVFGKRVPSEKLSEFDVIERDDENVIEVCYVPDGYEKAVIGNRILFRGTVRPLEYSIFDTDKLFFVRPQNIIRVL